MFPSCEVFILLSCSSSVCEVVFLLVLLPMWFSLFEVVFLLSCLLVRLSSSAYEVVFLSYEVFFLCLWGCLPFLWSFLPVRTSSCEVLFMWYHLPMATASLDKTVVLFPIVCGSGGGGWVGPKSENNFWPFFLPFRPIWNNFDLFIWPFF